MTRLESLVEADRACAGVPVEIFFDGSTMLQARQICRGCPVQLACLEYAIEHPQHGVWGGTSTKERAQIARNRGRSYNPARDNPLAGPPLSQAALERRKYRRGVAS